MPNQEFVFRGWATPIVLHPGVNLSINELLAQYDQNKSRVTVDPRLKESMEQCPAMFSLDKVFQGTNCRRVGEALNMKPFRLKARPAMVLATCADNTYFALDDKNLVMKPLTELLIQRYPRIVGHIICHSLGYATPGCAARILNDAANREENWCEWIYSCYQRNPLPAVQHAIAGRRSHSGYMSEYKLAQALVQQTIATGKQPQFASWF